MNSINLLTCCKNGILIFFYSKEHTLKDYYFRYIYIYIKKKKKKKKLQHNK
ncbi:hypothetical protein PFFVO_02230, partial [Plasmodium falciparum Vietnam Oak-Knoll (FVO)]